MGLQSWHVQKEAKLRKDFASTINIHCICHWIALGCADIGDNHKFINICLKKLEILQKLIKQLKIYIRITLKCKEFDTMSNKQQKKIVKRVKKACRTCWLSLHAGVDTVFNKYEGIVKTLQEIQSDCSSRSLANVLLKKIKVRDFIENTLSA